MRTQLVSFLRQAEKHSVHRSRFNPSTILLTHFFLFFFHFIPHPSCIARGWYHLSPPVCCIMAVYMHLIKTGGNTKRTALPVHWNNSYMCYMWGKIIMQPPHLAQCILQPAEGSNTFFITSAVTTETVPVCCRAISTSYWTHCEGENKYFGILNLQLFLCPCHSMTNKFQLLPFVYSGVMVTVSRQAFFNRNIFH